MRKTALHIDVHPAAGKAYAPALRRALARAHPLLHRPALRELSLALVGDARMAALHVQFLGIPGPTDVLTFPLETNSRGHVTAGEVVVCVPYARRQARRRGHPLRHELLLYALHGMLHLCGYDDKTPRDFRRIHRAEDMILTKLGVGPVFAPHRGAARRKSSGLPSKGKRAPRRGAAGGSAQ